jgi:hypothetical protein
VALFPQSFRTHSHAGEGVMYIQWDDEKGPVISAESRPGPEPAPRSAVSSTRSRHEPQRQHSDGEYPIASARQPSIPTTYRFNPEPRTSQSQTPAYTVVRPGRDPRTPQQEPSMAPPYSLFPREDVPLTNHDFSPVSRHESMTLDSDKFGVRSNLIEPKASDHQALDHRTPRQGTGRQLSALAELSQIRCGDFVSRAKFLMENPGVLSEDTNGLMQEAQRLQEEGRPQQVLGLVHTVILLRSCSKLPREGARAYLRRMTSGDPKTVRPLLEDAEKVMSKLNANAAQARGQETDPKPPILTNYPDSQLIVEGEQQRRFPANEGYPTDLSRRESIDQNLSTATQQLNIGGHMATRRLVGLAMADTRETSRRRPSEDDYPSIGALSVGPDIRGSSVDHEELDPRYRRRIDAEKFFVPGRVLALLWHESAGDSKPDSESSFVAQTTRGRYGEKIFSHIRRMVVVKERQGYCVCIPINTYGGQGVSKHGLSDSERKAHAVIHSSNTSPGIKGSEKGSMIKSPIAVDMASAEQKLDRMSRLNFSRPHSVEWNVKVMNVGMVTKKSMPSLMAYFHTEMVD